jgi:orotidine-5'-phosphate decarboxylase
VVVPGGAPAARAVEHPVRRTGDPDEIAEPVVRRTVTETRQEPGRYLAKLAARVERTGSVLCLGIDPVPDQLPAGFPRSLDGIERFARLLLDAAGPYAAAVKPNLAFFEAWGSAGIAALERFRALVPADLPVILDAKRADIGTTSAAAARALYDALGADAVTVNPYLGGDAVEPFVTRDGGFAYVLCRTSNPGAGEFQDLVVEGEPLFLHVARRVAAWAPRGDVGLVVGATAPAELARVRDAVPTVPFLVPGVGAQGGAEGPVLDHGRATDGPASAMAGGGLLVNVSRGISGAALGGEDPAERLRKAADAWGRRLRVLA